MKRALRQTFFVPCLAIALLAGCTARPLDVPLDLWGVDFAAVDLAMPDLATADLSDLAIIPVDLSDPFVPDLAPGAPIPPTQRLVYAHSDSVLYTVDPSSLQVSEIGPFIWPRGEDSMTDIAIDRNGNMVGVSESDIYAVDPATANCIFLSVQPEGGMNGLSFVASSDLDASEVLIGTAGDTVYRIDPLTGAASVVGSWDDSWASSGDVVSVEGATYATVVDANGPGDLLIRVDPSTGAATAIGHTGFSEVWGLGYWKQQLFGFTEGNGIVLIDINTGAATPVFGTDSFTFWGAAVITTAPTH